jgi:DNA-binding MarR family transcriptional regulator
MERVINKRDKRSFGLRLTVNGDQLMKLYIDYQSEMGSKILNGLSDEEQNQLIRLLEKISARVIPKKTVWE